MAAERQILDNLKADARKIEDAIDTEKAERMEMQTELMNKLDTELKRQRTKIERIKADTLSEFAKDKTDTTKEINNRFEHQDRTILNISHFISTFQKTLKAVGGKD